MNQIAWQKPDPVPNALHTAFTQTKAVAICPCRRLLAQLRAFVRATRAAT
jgi:hypothetical protein